MTGCLLHHKRSLKGKDVVLLTVRPDDGRDPEVFRVSPTELRRFAWSLLADYDPDEAQAAAAEAGCNLAAFTAQAKVVRLTVPRVAHRERVRTAIQHGSPHHAALEAMRDAPIFATQAPFETGHPSGRARVFNELGAMDLAQRLNRGKQGTPGLWGLTEAGAETLAALGPLQAERRVA